MTQSEELFEAYCRERRYACLKLPTNVAKRTADYRILVGAQTIVCEITEFTPNDADELVAAALDRVGYSGLYERVGRRIEIKARAKKRQLKVSCGNAVPGMFVFFQPDGLGGEYLTEDDFEAAMFGLPTASRLVNRVPLGHDAHGICGPRRGRYISAFARLLISEFGELALRIFHNPFASNPIPSVAFTCPEDVQLVKQTNALPGEWGWRSAH